MSILSYILAFLCVRQSLTFFSTIKASKYISGESKFSSSTKNVSSTRFLIFLPVLKEEEVLEETISYFLEFVGTDDRIIVITTERERKSLDQKSDTDTIKLADSLKSKYRFVHLHYPEKEGVKSDQLNWAVDHCLKEIKDNKDRDNTFAIIYDADSRPPKDSLDHFKGAISTFPDADIFHQSSRFELRLPGSCPRTIGQRLRYGMSKAGTLRANRFVLSYELPRLLAQKHKGQGLLNFVRSCVYWHVTGHGLCIRLSFLDSLRFPPGSPLEDMHYSFILAGRNERVIPLDSLDCVEVPANLKNEFNQLSRWFYGPSRFLMYRKDKNIPAGVRKELLSVHAFIISLEWLLSIFVLGLIIYGIFWGEQKSKYLSASLSCLYFIQLWIVDNVMERQGTLKQRLSRIMFYPFSKVLFSLAGWYGLLKMVLGDRGIGKTERARWDN